MQYYRSSTLLLLFFLHACQSHSTNEAGEAHIDKIRQTDGLIALWDFKEEAGEKREAQGVAAFPLSEANGEVRRMEEGPLSGYSALFDNEQYLQLSADQTGALNIHGTDQGVTVIAWIKWSGKTNAFVGGLWNEYQDGGKRQYGLFVSLPHYNGANQVCGHISRSGKPTPPFPYSIDYSASPQQVASGEWSCVAFTYDGTYIKSFYNGQFEAREAELISHTQGFEGYPDGLVQSKNPYHFPDGMGDNGSDFTVGAVLLKAGMGNFFEGQLGGLAVFDRALSEDEMQSLAVLP